MKYWVGWNFRLHDRERLHWGNFEKRLEWKEELGHCSSKTGSLLSLSPHVTSRAIVKHLFNLGCFPPLWCLKIKCSSLVIWWGLDFHCQKQNTDFPSQHFDINACETLRASCPLIIRCLVNCLSSRPQNWLNTKTFSLRGILNKISCVLIWTWWGFMSLSLRASKE